MNPLSNWYRGMRADWPMVPLRGVAALGTGHTPDRTKPEYWENCTIPWVTAADLSTRPSEFEPLTDTSQYVSHLGVANSSAVVHPAGTVMFCRTASVGLLTITDKPMATTQAFVTWTAGANLLPRYLLFVIAAMRPELMRIAYGSTHLTIYMPDLKALEIPLPPLDEQRRIADFLDDQVEQLNRAVLARQKQRALFRERFDSALNDAFELADWIPLKRAAWWIEGPGIMTSEFREEGRPVIRLSGVRADTVTLDGCNFVDETEAQRRWQHLAVRPGELLISGSGGVRFPVVIPEEIAGAIPYTGLIRVGTRGSTSREVLRYFLGSPVFARQIDQLKSGVGIQHWGPGHLAQVAIPEMQPSAQQRVTADLTAIEQHQADLLRLAEHHAKLLEERKQALITAAVTGQLDVPTARSVA